MKNQFGWDVPPTILLDSMTKATRDTLANVHGGWFIARPVDCRSWRELLIAAVGAWRVLIGKAVAVQYAQDIEESEFARHWRPAAASEAVSR